MDGQIILGTEEEQAFTGDYYLTYRGTSSLKSVELHRHGFFEFVFLLNGNVHFTVDNFSYDQKYGNILVVPPLTLHKALIDLHEPYRRYVLWIKSDFMENLVQYDPSMMFLFQRMKSLETYQLQIIQKDMALLIRILSEIMEIQHTQEFGYMTKCKSKLHELFYHVNSTLYHETASPHGHPIQETHLKIAEYIKKNLTSDLSLDHLSTQFYMSKYHMLHLFKEKMSISIHKYIVIHRLEYAKSLMLSSTPISKLHVHTGFKDYATFYRAFKKRYGMSPKLYYKLHYETTILQNIPLPEGSTKNNR